MCDICDAARKLPKYKALELVARAMQTPRFPACLDKLVGELCGEPTPETNAEVEAAWESGRRS